MAVKCRMEERVGAKTCNNCGAVGHRAAEKTKNAMPGVPPSAQPLCRKNHGTVIAPLDPGAHVTSRISAARHSSASERLRSPPSYAASVAFACAISTADQRSCSGFMRRQLYCSRP